MESSDDCAKSARSGVELSNRDREKEGIIVQTFLRIDVNLFMAIVCAIIYFSSRRMSESGLIHNRLFRWLTISVFLLLIVESLTWVFDGSTARSALLIDYFITMCLYLLTPIPSLRWELYVKLQLFHDPKSVKGDLIGFGALIAVCVLLTFITPFTNLMFYFDASGVYHLYTEHGPAGRLQNGAEVTLITAPPLHVAERKANDLIKAKQTQRDAYRIIRDQRFASTPQAPNIPPPPSSSKPVKKDRISIETLSAPSRQLLNNLF